MFAICLVEDKVHNHAFHVIVQSNFPDLLELVIVQTVVHVMF